MRLRAGLVAAIDHWIIAEPLIIKFRKIDAAFFSSDEEAWKNKGHRHAITVYIVAYYTLGGKTGEESARKKGEDYLSSAVEVPATKNGKRSFLKAELSLQRVDKTGKTGTLDNEWLRDIYLFIDHLLRASLRIWHKTRQKPGK